MLGSHPLKTWSSTQDVVALSSGEAEFYAIVKGASQGFGMSSMFKDFGIDLSVSINTDASAARSIGMRKGLGRMRHIEVHQLWVQDRVASGSLVLNKVSTDENLSDVLTKYVDRKLLDRHTHGMSLVSAAGRHPLAPEVRG